MLTIKDTASKLVLLAGTALLFASCQKLDRPGLGDYPLDPDPPSYTPLKSFWAFEDNLNDEGESQLEGTGSNVSYAAGINGKALKINAGGYYVWSNIGESTEHQNGFIGYPKDTLSKIQEFSVSLWINGTGPVDGGAQGIFSLSNKNQFWGNFDVFLENYNGPSGSDAWIKIHLFNSKISGGGEEWIADDATKFPNVLNKWTHLVFTYDKTTSVFTTYIDGAVADQRTLGGGSYGPIEFNDFNGLAIGAFQFQTTPNLSNHGPESWAASFNGSIDQVRVYTKPLSAAEVTDLFNNHN